MPENKCSKAILKLIEELDMEAEEERKSRDNYRRLAERSWQLTDPEELSCLALPDANLLHAIILGMATDENRHSAQNKVIADFLADTVCGGQRKVEEAV